MSHTFPNPPPPVPAPKRSNGTTIPSFTYSRPAAKTNIIDECLWAADFNELQKACYLARVCPINPPRKCQYHNIASILQEGPTCGLTALSMLLGGMPSPNEFLAMAKELHFTNNGEIFSAKSLFHLISDHFEKALSTANSSPHTNECHSRTTIVKKKNSRNAAAADVLDCEMYNGRLNCVKVKDCLLAGACLFVPYPFYKNN